jgi:hypothetical protein
MANINQLPYFQLNNTKETNIIARFLLKKIKKILQEKTLYHYLIFARQDKRLKYIQELSKKYKYFLKIDIKKYYPSISHKILMFRSRTSKHFNFNTRRMRHYLKYEIPEFLREGPIKDKGLPVGNYLSWVLTGLYLLPLDFKIPRPFLRIQDDYLIFCKHKKEPEKILKEIIEPELEKLELKINVNKLNSGWFHQNAIEFMGFRYYAGIFTISKKKTEEFKNKIIKVTHLTKKKPEKAIVKSLNNKILGFGHYYKFAYCKQDFEKLDAFIRQRLRRYLVKNKDQKQKIGNLLLTNQQLENFGLKSLTEIKGKYARRKRHILRKTGKKKGKIGRLIRRSDLLRRSDLNNYQQKAVLKQLQELTKNVRQIKNKMAKIEKKLEKSN